MKIEPRKPHIPFDFGAAITQPFRSADGTRFALRLVAWMTAGLMFFYLITMPFILPHYGAIMEFSWLNMQAALNGTSPPDPSQMLGIYAKLALPYSGLLLGMWTVMASGEAAMHRKVLLGVENPRGPLRFGKEELRVMLVQLGVWALVLLAYIGGAFILALMGGALMAAIPILGAIVFSLGGLALFGFLIWLPIRLGPAAALTINQGKRHLLAANKVTKFRFWNLFLAYLVSSVLGYLLLYTVMGLAVLLVAGDSEILVAMSGLGAENPTVAFEALGVRLKNPLFLGLGLVLMTACIAAMNVWLLCVAGVGTYAVKWWREEDPSAKFD